MQAQSTVGRSQPFHDQRLNLTVARLSCCHDGSIFESELLEIRLTIAQDIVPMLLLFLLMLKLPGTTWSNDMLRSFRSFSAPKRLFHSSTWRRPTGYGIPRAKSSSGPDSVSHLHLAPPISQTIAESFFTG
mmetsp:Transcript_35886/g.112261  ORF Transcript_35886/g.112261 Transcript_35886/m.112261 type:complete len:131 (+) Transcript_35886:485-877(+)